MQINSLPSLSAATSAESDCSGSSGGGGSYKSCFERTHLTIDRFMQGRWRLLQVQESIAQLEAEKDSLVYQVCDLRQLLKRIAEENQATRKVQRKLHTTLQARVSTLKSSLAVAEEHGPHMEVAAAFWAEWCA
jgi:hypothetical protein